MTSTLDRRCRRLRRVKRAAVVPHGRPRRIGPGLARLEAVAREEGVELASGSRKPRSTAGSHRRDGTDVDIAIVLGGDGTMLRALQRLPRDRIPVIGVNFGRVGFLSAIPRDELEAGTGARLRRRARDRGARDARGRGRGRAACRRERRRRHERRPRPDGRARMGDRRRGLRPRPRATASSARPPSGSTAYNLSNGGPVLMWGLDAMALTFVAPHRPPRAAVRRAARQRPPRLEPHAGRRLRRARRRPPLVADLRIPAQRARSRASSALAALHSLATLPGRCTCLHPLPPSRCCAASGSRTSSSSVRPTSSRPRAEGVSGETGAGKTIFAQAIGLLLGVKGDAGASAPAGERGVRRGRARRARGVLRRRASWSRSRSCGRRTSRASSSPAASSPTAARAPTPGGGRSRARISPPPPSG